MEPVVRVLPTRSANRPPVTKAPAVKDKLKDKSTGACRVEAIIPGTVLPFLSGP